MTRFFYPISSFLIILIVLLGCEANRDKSGEKAYIKEINDQRTSKYNELVDSTKSRFNTEERAKFAKKKLEYFDPDISYNVDAVFTLDTSYPVIPMPTTTDRMANYRVYGFLDFKISDTLCRLNAYQNLDYKDHPEYGNLLFVPFKDNTNEFSTYGGGRYIDIDIPTTSNIKLDFNTSYNPYCAYNDRWSCLLVPFKNHLDVDIFAGEKKYK